MLPNNVWDDAAREAREATAELVMATLLAGAAGGIDLMPGSIQQLVDWDVLNTQVLEFVRQYQFNLIDGITGTTRKQVSEAIDAWIRSGDALPVLEAQLEPVFGEVRARMISATEVTRAYAEGNTMAWQATGLVGSHRWNTANDELVCPLCGPLDGQTVELGQPFVVAGDGPITKPPRHVNCRCWVTPIVSEEGLREQIRGLFDVTELVAEIREAGVDVA